MTSAFAESIVEDASLAWLESLGYAVLHGHDISPSGDALTSALSQREREKYSDMLLEGRLRQTLVRLNPDLPPEVLEDAYRKLTRTDAPSLLKRNRAMHRMLVDDATTGLEAGKSGERAADFSLSSFPPATGWCRTSSCLYATCVYT